jgi:hypothetical protein
MAGGIFAAAQKISDGPRSGHEPRILQQDAERLLALANDARAAAGAGELKSDSALAAAAMQHCLRMAREEAISHRYAGEADLTDRAGQAGAHFSIVAENIAAGSDPTDPLEFQDGWMRSAGHRANLLNRALDSVGIAVVAGHGVVDVVADYARAVPFLNQTQVESGFAQMLRTKGLSIRRNNGDARTYCNLPEGGKSPYLDSQPQYRMHWQNSDVSHLPEALLDQIEAQNYREAAVGSCSPQDVNGQFTVYRVAVLLYVPAPGLRRLY